MKAKKRAQVMTTAFALTGEVLARLDARGVPPACWPSRDDVLLEVLPLARRLVKAHARTATLAEALAAARWLASTENARATAKLDRLAARLADVPLPEGPARFNRSVPFRPGDWTLALAPAAGVAASVREAA